MQAIRRNLRRLGTNWGLFVVVSVLSLPLIGSAQDKSTLPYISSSVDVVISSRPARIMRSDDFRELPRKGGESLEKMIDKMTDSYFKLSLAEIKDIDQIIYEIRDGSSNTIIAVEAKRNVHWAKPEDIQIDAERGLPKFGGFHKHGFNAALADGSVRFISDRVDRDVLWQLYTASGGEVVDQRKLDVVTDEDDRR